MPFNIKKSGDKYKVVGPWKDQSYHVYGTHDKKEDAIAQQKALYVHTESTNNAIKKVGEQPVPATNLKTNKDNSISNIQPASNNQSELLPTHVDNREITIGLPIEMENESDKKKAIQKVLYNLTTDPAYYSNKITNGEIKNKKSLELYQKYFKRDSDSMVPYKNIYAEVIKNIKDKIRDELSESFINGGNVSEKPEEAFVRPNTERDVRQNEWFMGGDWKQVNFPVSDNPFDSESGYREAIFIQKTAAVPEFNSAESDNFVTSTSGKDIIKKLNKIDVKVDTKNAKELHKITKPKKMKVPKLESVNSSSVKELIKEELRKYLEKPNK